MLLSGVMWYNFMFSHEFNKVILNLEGQGHIHGFSYCLSELLNAL